MVLEKEGGAEIEGGGARPPGPPPVTPGPAAPAPAGGLFGLGDLLTLLKQIFAYIRGGVYEYIKPGTNVIQQQFTVTDTVNFTQVATIPPNALEWELFNATLTGTPTGFLDWAYVPQPGNIGNGNFNELASGQTVSRKLVGVPLYVRPQNSGQVCILEVTLP